MRLSWSSYLKKWARCICLSTACGWVPPYACWWWWWRRGLGWQEWWGRLGSLEYEVSSEEKPPMQTWRAWHSIPDSAARKRRILRRPSEETVSKKACEIRQAQGRECLVASASLNRYLQSTEIGGEVPCKNRALSGLQDLGPCPPDPRKHRCFPNRAFAERGYLAQWVWQGLGQNVSSVMKNRLCSICAFESSWVAHCA